MDKKLFGFREKINFSLCFALFFCMGSILQAQSKAEQRLTPLRLLNQDKVFGVSISPDGKQVIFAVTETDTTDLSSSSDIWIAPTDGSSKPRKLTFHEADEFGGQWSPDGSYISFHSPRQKDASPQLYLLDTRRVVEAFPISVGDKRINRYKWSSDSQILYFISDSSDKRSSNIKVFDGRKKYYKLYAYKVKSKSISEIISLDKQVVDYAQSPDGKKFALLLSEPGADHQLYRSKLYFLDLQTQELKYVMNNARSKVMWAPSGSKILFYRGVGHVGKTNLPYIYDLISKKTIPLFQEDYLYPEQIEWLGNDNQLLVKFFKKGKTRLGLYDIDNEEMSLVTNLDFQFASFSIDRGGRTIAFTAGSYNQPPDVFTYNLVTDKRNQITELNSGFDKYAYGDVELVSWKSFDGLDIQGVLIKPVGYVENQRYPAVIQIHGGPESYWTSGWLADWHDWAQLLVNNGYVILYPNIRGSRGYGVEFIESNTGDLGGADYRDVISASDYLIESGIVDPESIGLSGWSYGGYMTAWAVTQTNRFKAAIVGAGPSNLETQYRTSDNDIMWDYYLGPLRQNSDFYRMRSPVNRAKSVTTPTLIIHGEEDRRVAVSQAHELYHEFTKSGVPAEMVIYPSEGHGIRNLTYQKDLMERVLVWFNRYLK